MTSFVPDGLIGAAVAQTGLSDFGGDSFREGLEVYCDSLEHEAQLSELGVMALQGNLVANLANRLKTIGYLTENPSASGEVIDKPLFVIGLFRAGTTLFNNLLDLDPANRSLLVWEAADSAPPSTPVDHRESERVELSRLSQAMLDGLNPEFKSIHHEQANGPTECITVLGEDFKALLWESVANVPAYGEWLLKTDHTSAYLHHKRTLQVLQSGGVRGRWTLKTPHHALALDALTAVYPDAELVYLHRDPVQVATSAFSLIRCLSGTFTDADHTAYIVKRWTDILVACAERVDAFRDSHPDVTIHDLSYRDLVADPVATVGKVYDLDPQVAARMQEFVDANPKGKHGAHRYTPEDFGTTAGVLRERFGSYLDRYDVTSTTD